MRVRSMIVIAVSAMLVGVGLMAGAIPHGSIANAQSSTYGTTTASPIAITSSPVGTTGAIPTTASTGATGATATSCGSPAIDCVVVPASGTFTLPMPCGGSLTGTGSSDFAGTVIYARAVAYPMQLVSSCSVVINGLPNKNPAFPNLTPSTGTWYLYSYALNQWASVTTLSMNGVYSFVP